MSLATVFSRAPLSMEAALVTVEIHLSSGLPMLTLVGLPEKAVKESKDRVRAALLNSGFNFPQKRITINLAPANLPKDGTRYDLPIALGILIAAGEIPADFAAAYEWHGELALSGELRAVGGILPCARAARKAQKSLVVAPQNYHEAALLDGLQVRCVKNLRQIADIAHERTTWQTPPSQPPPLEMQYPDFEDVIGQHQAKRALLIAAAGGHHVLISGAPGTGKSMLAQRFPGIMPPMSENEALQAAAILSISQYGFDLQKWRQRPFRAPHHSASASAMVGGGSIPRPGEISLAHCGVLFLDELPEFDRRVLEMLREPLENRHITISRTLMQSEFPARFQLIAAMNPCPCGYYGDSHRHCSDTPDQVARYRKKISGPLLDRIDIQLHVKRITDDVLTTTTTNKTSSCDMRRQVAAAYAIQQARQGMANAQLNNQNMQEHLHDLPESRAILQRAVSKMGLSLRAAHRTLKVARTIADLEASEELCSRHVAEALQYRLP